MIDDEGETDEFRFDFDESVTTISNPQRVAEGIKDIRKDIGVKMKVKLDYIDDILEEIHMKVQLCLHFSDDNSKIYINGSEGFVLVDFTEGNIFCPVIEFENSRRSEHVEGFKALISTLTGMVYVYRKYHVVTHEILELQKFPFDRQIIKCYVKSFASRLVTWTAEISDSPIGVRSDTTWAINDIVVEYEQYLWLVEWISATVESDERPAQFRVEFGLSRTTSFYITNFVLITFFLVVSSLSCIAIEYDDFGSRAGITFTLLLTLVALKFVMTSYIPKINYLTLLDYYNIFGMLMIIAVIIENFGVSQLFHDSAHTPKKIDIIFALVYLVVWVLLHCCIVIGAYYGLFYENWTTVRQNDNSSLTSQRLVGNVLKKNA
jgi:hypothetical protein